MDAQSFLDFSKAKEDSNADSIKEAGSKLDYHILSDPTDSTLYAGYSTTKNYLINYMLDDVKKQLKFFKIGEDGGPFVMVGGGKEGQIRAASSSGVDSKESDLLWLTTLSYNESSTLHLVDASKCGEKEYIVSKLKSLPHMVSVSFVPR